MSSNTTTGSTPWCYGKAVRMVVGVRRSLEEGKVYSRSELAQRFGLADAALTKILDHLLEHDRVKPVALRQVWHGDMRIVRCASYERELLWQAQ